MDATAVLREVLLVYRGNEKISQEEMAARCLISSRYYRKLENGAANPSLSVLTNIRKGCGIDLNRIADQAEEIK